MSYGLRVWDPSGNMTLDMSDRATRFYSRHVVSVPSEGSVTVPVTGISTNGTWGFHLWSLLRVSAKIVSGGVQIDNYRDINAVSATIIVFRV